MSCVCRSVRYTGRCLWRRCCSQPWRPSSRRRCSRMPSRSWAGSSWTSLWYAGLYSHSSSAPALLCCMCICILAASGFAAVYCSVLNLLCISSTFCIPSRSSPSLHTFTLFVLDISAHGGRSLLCRGDDLRAQALLPGQACGIASFVLYIFFIMQAN